MRAWRRTVLAALLLTGLMHVEAVAHGASDHTHLEEVRILSEDHTVPEAPDEEPVAPGESPSLVDFERVLDARLRALEQEVRKLREAVERPGLAEIVGGLGWIAGLAALAYAWKRRGRG